jgi:hypothetical protein
VQAADMSAVGGYCRRVAHRHGNHKAWINFRFPFLIDLVNDRVRSHWLALLTITWTLAIAFFAEQFGAAHSCRFLSTVAEPRCDWSIVNATSSQPDDVSHFNATTNVGFIVAASSQVSASTISLLGGDYGYNNAADDSSAVFDASVKILAALTVMLSLLANSQYHSIRWAPVALLSMLAIVSLETHSLSYCTLPSESGGRFFKTRNETQARWNDCFNIDGTVFVPQRDALIDVYPPTTVTSTTVNTTWASYTNVGDDGNDVDDGVDFIRGKMPSVTNKLLSMRVTTTTTHTSHNVTQTCDDRALQTCHAMVMGKNTPTTLVEVFRYVLMMLQLLVLSWLSLVALAVQMSPAPTLHSIGAAAAASGCNSDNYNDNALAVWLDGVWRGYRRFRRTVLAGIRAVGRAVKAAGAAVARAARAFYAWLWRLVTTRNMRARYYARSGQPNPEEGLPPGARNCCWTARSKAGKARQQHNGTRLDELGEQLNAAGDDGDDDGNDNDSDDEARDVFDEHSVGGESELRKRSGKRKRKKKTGIRAQDERLSTLMFDSNLGEFNHLFSFFFIITCVAFAINHSLFISLFLALPGRQLTLSEVEHKWMVSPLLTGDAGLDEVGSITLAVVNHYFCYQTHKQISLYSFLSLFLCFYNEGVE